MTKKYSNLIIYTAKSELFSQYELTKHPILANNMFPWLWINTDATCGFRVKKTKPRLKQVKIIEL